MTVTATTTGQPPSPHLSKGPSTCCESSSGSRRSTSASALERSFRAADPRPPHRAGDARSGRPTVGESIIRLGRRRGGVRASAPPPCPADAGGPGGQPSKGDTPLTLLTHELKASYAFVERNFFLTRRYWGWEIAFLVYSVAGALSISADRRRGGRRRACSSPS